MRKYLQLLREQISNIDTKGPPVKFLSLVFLTNPYLAISMDVSYDIGYVLIIFTQNLFSLLFFTSSFCPIFELSWWSSGLTFFYQLSFLHLSSFLLVGHMVRDCRFSSSNSFSSSSYSTIAPKHKIGDSGPPFSYPTISWVWANLCKKKKRNLEGGSLVSIFCD